MLSNETTIINGMVRNKNEMTRDKIYGISFMGGIAYLYTYEAWQRACKENYSSVQFEGDKTFCKAKPGIGEWDGIEGVVYTKDSKTKDEGDQTTSYKGYKIEKKFDDNQGWLYTIIDPEGKAVSAYTRQAGGAQSAKDWIDAHTKDSK